ncbi:MAG: hypothetical protein C5B48_15985 [Candidatus Rokuibacteriota bacterium]|nr:MAG: hypothetical protein C5B48_15985 [Candidatus Rokubacteria bacterium]
MPLSKLASAWQLEALVLVTSAIALLLFAQGFARLRRRGRHDHAALGRAVLFVVAVAAGTLALVSPLDAAGESYLLSAHMLQHLVIADAVPALALVALRGPLLFFFLPAFLLRPLARMGPLRSVASFLLRPRISFAAWALVIAAWHVPVAYDYTLGHPVTHSLEHASFLLVGLLVWFQLVDPARRGVLTIGQRLAYAGLLFGSGLALVCVLIASPGPLYPTYAAVQAHLFGLSPLQDQRLAGVLMVAEQMLALGACVAFLLPGRRRTPACGARARAVLRLGRAA